MKIKANIRSGMYIIFDLILIVVSVLGSYLLRLEFGDAFFNYSTSFYWMLGVALVVKPLVYYSFGLYRRVWTYASIKELQLIVTAVTVASVLVAAIMSIVFTLGAFYGFPRSVLVIDWLVSISAVGGMRIVARVLAESQKQAKNPKFATNPRRVLVVGAGDAGALVVRELQKNPQVNQIPVSFLDDNANKQHQQIHGVPVVGTLPDLAHVLDRQRIDEVIIAIPSAPGKVMRMVSDVCRLKGIPFRTMPGIYELLGGKVSINRLREVDISDLLQREPVRTRDEVVGTVITGQRVMVTGAGGSIGRELCRQIARWGPSELILLGHGENSIFESYLELHEGYPALVIHPVIADVRDRPRLEEVFEQRQPQVVFHAAAHKHVPLMEINVEDAITNNVMGTRNLVRVAEKYKTRRLVMISTDKAIHPANVMGATKRLAEMLVLDAAARTGNAFSVVRFGNVLGSRGSVVPLFKRQIARGGPVTITHPDMKRYFMTIPEAVYLVLQAATISSCGETFVLNMGQQVRILDLAEDLIRLSGLEPGKDIEIAFTGIRPGEKLSEELWEEGCQFNPTDHPEVFRLDSQDELRNGQLDTVVDRLIDFAQTGQTQEVIKLIDETIPGSSVGSTPPPEINSIT
jgi:FlaA1/EpsC-like NDP-sugar epimerase